MIEDSMKHIQALALAAIRYHEAIEGGKPATIQRATKRLNQAALSYGAVNLETFNRIVANSKDLLTDEESLRRGRELIKLARQLNNKKGKGSHA